MTYASFEVHQKDNFQPTMLVLQYFMEFNMPTLFMPHLDYKFVNLKKNYQPISINLGSRVQCPHNLNNLMDKPFYIEWNNHIQ